VVFEEFEVVDEAVVLPEELVVALDLDTERMSASFEGEVWLVVDWDMDLLDISISLM